MRRWTRLTTTLSGENGKIIMILSSLSRSLVRLQRTQETEKWRCGGVPSRTSNNKPPPSQQKSLLDCEVCSPSDWQLMMMQFSSDWLFKVLWRERDRLAIRMRLETKAIESEEHSRTMERSNYSKRKKQTTTTTTLSSTWSIYHN